MTTPLKLLVLALLLVCACHVTTLRVYPPPWGDEAYFVELGRSMVFDRGTEWSPILRAGAPSGDLEPVAFFSYVSGAIEELIYRASGVWWAHRLFPLFGMLTAALLAFFWLAGKGRSAWTAGCVAFMFATEINFTRSVRFARPDAWVLALTFAGALLISGKRWRSERAEGARFALVGALMALQLLFWFAAVFSWPLLLAEFVAAKRDRQWAWPAVWRRLAAMAAGGFAVLLLLLFIPFRDQLSNMAGAFLNHPDFVLPAGAGSSRWHTILACLRLLPGRLAVFSLLLARAPFVWLLAVFGVALMWRRERVFMFWLLASAMVMVATNVYCFRIIYLLPLAMFAAAGALDRLADAWLVRGRRRRLAAGYASLAVLFGIATGAVSLNCVAGMAGSGANHALLADSMRAIVPYGSRIYLFGWQPYFIGRQLGWHLYAFLPGYPKEIFRPELRDFLAGMDYVLVQERGDGLQEQNDCAPLSAEEKALLAAQGFEAVLTVEPPAAQVSPLMRRLRRLVCAWQYPAFSIWRRRP